MTATGMKIAIVGAGIGGLAAAAALRRFGIAAEVYEQATAFGHVGAGIQLTANATKALAGFGLLPRLRAAGFAPALGYNRAWDTGEATNILPMGTDIEDRYGAPDLSMHRAHLHAALTALVPAAAIHHGRRLVGLDRAAGAIRLSFADGGTVTADAVVGADGVHSVVRETLFGPEKPHFLGKAAYRTILPTAAVKGVPVDERVKWWGPDRHIVSYMTTPNRDHLYYIAAVPEPDFTLESWSAVGDLGQLLAAFEGFHPQARALLAAATDVRKWALIVRDPMPSWGDGNVVLLGDACHPMPPTIAQGGGSAIEDAIVLARCLAETGGDGIADAFARYQALRRDRTARMQVAAIENTWMRFKTDADWVYGYDAWTTPLHEPAPAG